MCPPSGPQVRWPFNIVWLEIIHNKPNQTVTVIPKSVTVVVCFHLVFTGLVQDVQGLHGNGLTVIVQLCDQQLHAPTTEELHAGPQQHAQVFGGIQPAGLSVRQRLGLGLGGRRDLRSVFVSG